MGRGGERENAGRKSSWVNNDTTLIRIPKVIKDPLMAIAKKLDRGKSIENETKSNQIEIETVTESKLDSVTVSIKEIVDRYKDEYLKITPDNTSWTQAKKLLIDLELSLYGETSLESVTKSRSKKKEANSIQNDSVTNSNTNNTEIVTNSKGYEIEQFELIPSIAQQSNLEPLSQVELADRLKVSGRSIRGHKQDLPEWSKTKDPDQVAWEYREDTKKYYPLNL
jgi:hypothetical protein